MRLAYRHRVLGMLILLAVVTYVDRVCISVAGTTMQKDLGLTSEQWGWVLGAFALSYGLFEIPSGALGDRLGPRRVLARIVTWWSAFTAREAGRVGRGARGHRPQCRWLSATSCDTLVTIGMRRSCR